MIPNLYPHRQVFRESKHIFIRLVVTDEKQTGLPKMDHTIQRRPSFLALPRREIVH